MIEKGLRHIHTGTAGTAGTNLDDNVQHRGPGEATAKKHKVMFSAGRHVVSTSNGNMAYRKCNDLLIDCI